MSKKMSTLDSTTEDGMERMRMDKHDSLGGDDYDAHGPATTAPTPTDLAMACRFSSHVLRLLTSWIILSRRPWRTSLMLTLPVRISLSSRKSKSLKRPSSLSSFGPRGNTESGTPTARPLIASARRKITRPVASDCARSVTWRELGRCELIHLTSSSSSGEIVDRAAEARIAG